MERLDLFARQCSQGLVRNGLNGRKCVLHPVIEFIENELKTLFRTLLLRDVRIRAKPSKHIAVIVLERLYP